MTSLLPSRDYDDPTTARRSPGGSQSDAATRRPLVLVATLGGVVAAASTLLVCLAAGVVGWFLTDGGAHGEPRDGLRTGAVAWLMGHGSGVSIDRVRIEAVPLGITLGAQVGVALPIVLVFGRLPLVSVPANLLAVPVAGAVMLYGLPAGLVAGLVGEWLPWSAPVLMAPARCVTRWVDTVAMLGERLEPEPPWPWLGWAVITIVCVVVVAVGARRGKNQALHGDTSSDR